MRSVATHEVDEYMVATVLRDLADRAYRRRSEAAIARRRYGGRTPSYLTIHGEPGGVVAQALWALGVELPDIAALHCSAEQLHVACIPALARFNPMAIALLAYVQRQHDDKRIVSHVVEEALRPRFWHTHRWHRRHRPWMV